MQLIKNTIKMLDDITMLDHNVQKKEQETLGHLQRFQHILEPSTMTMTTTTTKTKTNATSFLQTTCTNVPVLSSPTPLVISLENSTTTITKLRTTKKIADAQVNNVAIIEQTTSNDNNLQIKYKNNNSNNKNKNNNNNNKNSSNYINTNNKKLEDDNKNYSMKSVSGSSCCQRCCEHKNHYEQHAMQKQQQQQQQQQQPAVHRHVKHPKTSSTVADSAALNSDERLKRVARNCDNNNNNNNNIINNVECSKQGKLYEKHHCTASLLIVEEQRQFSGNATKTTTKCDEMSNMQAETVIQIQTPFAVKKCATVESSSSLSSSSSLLLSSLSTGTTTRTLSRLKDIGRTRIRPSTKMQIEKPTSIEIASLLSQREASTITLPQTLLEDANSKIKMDKVEEMKIVKECSNIVDNDRDDEVKGYKRQQKFLFAKHYDLSSNMDSMDVNVNDSVKLIRKNSMPIEENCSRLSKTTIESTDNTVKNMKHCYKVKKLHLVQSKTTNNHNTKKKMLELELEQHEITRRTRIYNDDNNYRIYSEYPSDKCFKLETAKANKTIKPNLAENIPLATLCITILSKLLATMALMAVTSIRKITTTILSTSSYSSSYYHTWLSTTLTLLLLTKTAYCWNSRQDAMSNCTFPARWEGSWFLSGYQQSIHIKGSQFSYRGKCLASDGNKYLIVDEKGCHRCLVIYEKHKNVLQYKESECEGDSMYMHQANPPSALAMRSALLKQSQNAGGEHRGGAHPNIPNSELNTNTNTHPNIANGNTRLSSSDQFILRSNDDMNDYFCKGRETLQNLCDQIPGDALLYSLFRENADPVKCPLRGPFVFTYNRGHGECKSPLSNIESCTEESNLLLSFQACPDVQGTESTVEELTCLATWKDGNSRYLVGLVSHHHAISNEERYRCFVYEKLTALGLAGAPAPVNVNKDAEYKLAQSGDATCNGLDSAEVGSRIMSLRKPPLAERCDFPSWFKGPRHWHGLMGNVVYNYHMSDGSVHAIKPNGLMETRALCEQINKQTSDEMMAVVHYTTGCQSGFMCMMFYRRDTHVIEIQTGKPAARLEDACAPDHFDIMRMPFITLLATNSDPQECPMVGLYNLRGAIGPPYMTTRHKRNHSNKSHGNHGHHHQQQQQQLQQESEVAVKGHESMAYIGHKRHINSNMNYRNADLTEIRGRNRRALDKHERELHIISDEVNRSHNFTDDISLTTRNRRNVPPCTTNVKAQRRLWVGCTEPNIIDVRPLCTDDGDEAYSCHGSWMENGTTYIIAKQTGTNHGVCISYRPTEGNAAKLVIGDSCYRGMDPPPEHHLVANLSVFGKCGDTGNGAGVARRSTCFASWLALVALALAISSIGHWQDIQQR